MMNTFKWVKSSLKNLFSYVRKEAIPNSSSVKKVIPLGIPKVEIPSHMQQEVEKKFMTASSDDAILETMDVSNIREMIRKLKELDKIKSEFISLTSHQIRTPLAMIKTCLSNFRDKKIPPEGIPKMLEIAERSIDRLTRLINNTLDLSKIESGKMSYNFKNVDFKNIVQSIYEHFQYKFMEKNLTFEEHIDSDIPLIYADDEKIEEVLINLIGNSLEFTPAGGKISIGAKPFNGCIKIMVKDTGCGIAKEDYARLFEKFFQASSAKKKITGTGLGLFLAKTFIEAHDGKIELKSIVGQGTEVSFTLPIATKK